MHARAYNFFVGKNDLKSLFLALAFSALCHLIIFAAVLFAPVYTPKKKFASTIINVSMVTLPAQKTNQQSKTDIQSKKHVTLQKKASKPSNSAKAAVKTKSGPLKAVTATPIKTRIKRSLKKRTFNSSGVVRNAIAQIEKKVEQEQARPKSVTEAIDGLKDKIEKDITGPTAGISNKTKENVGTSPELIRIYQYEIIYHIKKNWVFPEQLAGELADLESRLVIEIMPSGEIKEVFFETKSGNSYLDDSAYRAVLKSNPLPPLPKGYTVYHILVGFTPSGIK